MPRIRTIKPEFWDSPDTASASLRTRLLFIAMWNWADDSGRGTANAPQLLGFAFPHDAELPRLVAEAPRVYAEVADAFGVVFYEANRRRYYAIPSWDEHQKNERRAGSKYPPPPSDISAAQRPAWASVAEMRGTSAQTHGNSSPGTGEQGNRGTGELTSVGKASCVSNARESSGRKEPDEPRGNGRSATPGADIVRRVIPDTHPAAVRTELRLQASALIKDGQEPGDVEAALQLWLAKPGVGPRVLPSLLSDVIKARAAPARNGADRKGNDYMRLAAQLDPANQTGLEALP